MKQQTLLFKIHNCCCCRSWL